MGKKGGGRSSVLQSLHLSCVCNESMDGMKCGGCVNLAVVPNESRSYSEEFLCLSGAVSMLQHRICILNRSPFSTCTCSAVKYIKFSVVHLLRLKRWADLAANFIEPYALWGFTAATESRGKHGQFCRRCLHICCQGPLRGKKPSSFLLKKTIGGTSAPKMLRTVSL